jgi:hypothetical protein
MNHRITITAVITTAVAGIIGAGAAPAIAGGTCTDRSARCVTVTRGPYAEPIAAIGGRTMAQYVADHQADDPRTATNG